MNLILGRRIWCTLAVLVSIALVITISEFVPDPVATAASASGAARTNPASDDQQIALDDPDYVRPDRTSAMVTARAVGHKVEDLSARSETTRVFALPNGSWSAESAPEPEQVQGEDGAWHLVDTDLVAKDGKIVPKWADADVAFSDGGDSTFASMTEDGKKLDWKWPSALPEPELDGSTATYPDVVPGGDLVVKATSTGFSQSVVLRERPDTDAGGTGTDADYQVKLPIATHGASLTESDDGALVVKSGGDSLVQAPAPMMFDSSEDAKGEPQAGDLDTVVGKTASGSPQLTLTADAGFLNDPDTQYPVIIDPSFRTYVTGDTWVASDTYTSGMVSNEELRAGTYTSGARKFRSFIHFNAAPWAGKSIQSANLVLRNWESASCTPGEIRVSKITESWTAADLTWDNQPAVAATGYGAISTPYGGGSGCPEGNAFVDITAMAKDWANGTSKNHGVRVAAADENSNATWRRYWSANYDGNHGYLPHVNVVYNTRPTVPAKPTLKPVASWAAPGDSTSRLYSSSARPTLSSPVTDGDGGNVRAVFKLTDNVTGTVTTCTSGWVSSGGVATCTPSADLAQHGYRFQVKADDGTDDSRLSDGQPDTAWSDSTWFVVGSATPPAPTVSCPSYAAGSWASTAPGGTITCTITATGTSPSAAGRIVVSVDQGTPKTIVIPQSSDPAVAKTTVTVPGTAGGHQITATAQSPAGTSSPTASYAFGFGQVGLASPPDSDGLPVTSGNVRIEANGPPVTGGGSAPTTHLRWRLAASGDNATTGWTEASGAGVSLTTTSTSAGVKVAGTWDTTTATHDDGTNTDLDARVPALLDVQVCVDYAAGSQCTWAARKAQILRNPHAFGDGYATTDVAGGQAALWTGEFAADDTDADLAAGDSSISISRSHASFAGDPTSTAGGVFGPGWTASLDGPEGGVSDLAVTDSTRRDGTITLTDDEGTVMVFGPKSGLVRRTGANLATGSWVPLDQDTALSGTTAKVSGTGASTTLTVTDLDGTVTTFKPATSSSAPSATAAGVFVPASVNEPGVGQTTTFSYDSAGRVTRMMAPTPSGVTCPATGTLPTGCRALSVTYATSTTASLMAPGDVAGQVKSISTLVGGTSTVVSTYTYDSVGRMVSQTDPRNSLTTQYGWDGNSHRLASITPAGLKPITYEYAGDDHRLARVKRERPAGDPAGGTATLATIVYGVPTKDSAGLPDLDAEGVSAWGQLVAPSSGVAVFGPDKPVSSLDPAQIATGDWAYASLSYSDRRGYETNTASYGAGDWQLTDTEYDARGNVVRSLDDSDIAAIRDGDIAPADAGTITTYNSEHTNAAGDVTLPAGSVAVDTMDTARYAILADGSSDWVRPKTHTTYDEGAPNGGIDPDTGQEWAQPTTVTSTVVDPATGAVQETTSTVTTTYGDAVPGDTTAGWKLGLAGSSTQVVPGGTDIVSRTRYDSQGRVTEQRQPKSNGTDAGTRLTSYYTAGSNSVAACGSKPAWDGATCQTRYAGAPSSGPALPTETVTSYNDQLQPLTTTETANGATRTTTQTYRSDGAALTSQTTASGLSGSTAVPKLTYSYDASTGLPTKTESTGTGAGDPVVTGYDAWGRSTTYSSVSGETTTTAYNAAGDVASVTDPKGTTTYTYDGTDARGKTERRGLVTKLAISNPSGRAVSFSGAYDGGGDLVRQDLPGGIIQRTESDTAGNTTSLTYSGQVTTVADDGSTSTDPDRVWLAWGQDHDASERVRHEWTPMGAVASGDAAGGPGSGYTRDYSYDAVSRLTGVTDRSAPVLTGADPETAPTSDDPDDPTGVATTCVSRAYAFDVNGNRTSRTTTPAKSDGTCQSGTGTGAVTKTWSYDSADRITGGYTYDALGRVTTLPQADSPAAAKTGGSGAGGSGPGVLTLGYYDSDAAKTITQNGTTTSFTLDTSGRRLGSTTGPTGGTAVSSTTRHYVDDSDNPGWASTTTGGSTTTERYAESLSGDLGVSIDQAGKVSLDVVTPHGDVAATISLPATGPATSIDGVQVSDEYGNPLNQAQTGTAPTNTNPAVAGGGAGDGSLGYGWLGGKQRATDSSGLSLMGARLYNPATGAFTSTDPVYGGNSASYAYPQDPINSFDLTGEWGCGWCKKAGRWAWKHKVGIGLTVAGFVPGLGVAAWGVRGFRAYRTIRAARASGKILGYTRHGLHRAIGGFGRKGIIRRGAHPRAIRDAVRSPKRVRRQGPWYNRTRRYDGKHATVILNKRQRIITTWPRKGGGRK